MRQTFVGTSLSTLRGKRGPTYLASPAAGKEWEYKLPGGYWYLIDSIHALLTTSAQIANRSPCLQVQDGDGNAMWIASGGSNWAASKSAHITYLPGVANGANTEVPSQTIALPVLILPGGWTIRSRTVALQTEDTYTEVRLMLQELEDWQPGQAAGTLAPGTHVDTDALPSGIATG